MRLRLAIPTSPIRPEPNSQTAAGTGTTAVLTKTEASELQPGERKVISDGSNGPVVEIIRKSASEEIAEDGITEDGIAEDVTDDVSESADE